MSKQTGRFYKFGPFRLDISERVLFRDRVPVALTPKAFDTLLALVSNGGHLIEKDQLIETLWPDTHVEEGNLAQQVFHLRKVLGHRPEGGHYIETVPRRGYRFVTDVREYGQNGEKSARDMSDDSREVRAAAVWRLRWLVGACAAVLALVAGFMLRDRIWPDPAAVRIMLVVLPFDNLTGDPDQEYFSDGLTEEMITQLGGAHPERLGVIARTSAMQYKGAPKAVDQIGRELGVDYVIEGSVRRDARRVRISAQLIRVSDQSHLWAESYERDLRDVLRLHREVALAVAREIELTLSPEQETRFAAARPVNPEVYEAYLRGMFYMAQSTPDGFKKGLEYLHQALEIDPADPLAYAGLAEGYVTLGHGPESSPKAFLRARAAAEKALQLDNKMARAVGVLADIKLYYEWDWAGAEEAFQRALALNPSLAMTHYHYAWYLALVGRFDEAIAEHKRAQELDPLRPLHTAWLGQLYLHKGQHEGAIKEARDAIELNPNGPLGYLVLGVVYANMGRFEEAIEAHEKMARASPDFGAVLAYTYALAGRRDEALKILVEVQADEDRPFGAFALAGGYATLGDKDEAFRWLEAGYEWRMHVLPWIRVNPMFQPLRKDPRFKDLLRRMNLPPV